MPSSKWRRNIEYRILNFESWIGMHTDPNVLMKRSESVWTTCCKFDDFWCMTWWTSNILHQTSDIWYHLTWQSPKDLSESKGKRISNIEYRIVEYWILNIGLGLGIDDFWFVEQTWHRSKGFKSLTKGNGWKPWLIENTTRAAIPSYLCHRHPNGRGLHPLSLNIKFWILNLECWILNVEFWIRIDD